MSIVRLLGSFPNSQIKPTSAVRLSDAYRVAIPANPTVVQVITANTERITATLFNSGTVTWFYDYQSANVLTEGLPITPGQSVTVEGGEVEVYVASSGLATQVTIDDRLG